MYLGLRETSFKFQVALKIKQMILIGLIVLLEPIISLSVLQTFGKESACL